MGPERETPLLDMVALLASLDVALWERPDCSITKVHFVERGDGQQFHTAEAYGQAVVRSLRKLEGLMPQGGGAKAQAGERFDAYQAQAGVVQVLSQPDDDFLVILAQQRLKAGQFRQLVGDCQGRTVLIVPVDDLFEIPRRYLKALQAGTGATPLQSMGVALGALDSEENDGRLLRFATALGAAGITAMRTIGREAFPQLAYSWDGLIPWDLTVKRPRGHFMAVEFDQPWVQIYETYRLLEQITD
jgi:hypothetical protein